MKKTKQKTLALLAPLVLACAGLASCADENLVNKNGGESVNPADFKLATSTVTFSADAGMQLPNVTRALDPDAPATRAVSLNERYKPMDNKDHSLNARVFVVRVDKNAKKTINGKEAVDADKVVMGAGDIKWDVVSEHKDGGVHLYSKESVLTLTWLKNSAVIKPQRGMVYLWYHRGRIQ